MNGRTRLLTFGVLVCWCVLIGRLVQMQGVSRHPLAQIVERQRIYTEPILARPGDLLDRRGRLLVTTMRTPSLYVDPQCLPNLQTAANELSRATGLSADMLRQRLDQYRDRRFVWIARRLSDDSVVMPNLPSDSWGLREEFRRVYPQGCLAAHVLGWCNIDGVGQAGLERELRNRLRGTDGHRTLIRDARGYVIDVQSTETKLPQHGESVVLTIDVVVQGYAEEQLDTVMRQWRPRWAAALVMDPQSGDLLAVAARPVFDPHVPGDAAPKAWLNPAVSCAYEPGSTLKPLFVGRALDKGLVKRDEVIDCEGGAYRMGPRILHDHHPYGPLSLGDILVKSSNIGMAKIGQRLTNTGLSRALHDFGFGQSTRVGLPAESAGEVRALESWDEYSTGSVPMGQEIAATPLQVITAFCALANGGRLVQPRLVQEDRRQQSRPRIASQVMENATVRWLTKGPLVEVVERGTARRARLDGLTVFGKTGTAQKYDAEQGGYSSSRVVTSCVVGAPAEDPRVVVLVVVDEPESPTAAGGLVAAPAAAQILQNTLNYLGRSTAESMEILADRRRHEVPR